MSVNDNEVRIKISADGSEAVDGLDAVEKSNDELVKALKEAQKELDNLRKEFKGVQSESQKLTTKTGALEDSVQALKGQTATLGKEKKQLGNDLKRVQGDLEKANVRVKGLEAQLRSLSSSSSQAGGNVKKASREFDLLGNASMALGERIRSLRDNWSDYTMGLNQSLEILEKTQRYLAAGWDLAEQGVNLEEAENAFESYADSVGVSGKTILEKLNTASDGTITRMGLITTASKAMSLGVTKDADKMANLLEIARNKARLFGMTTQQAFEDIVTGVGRASPLILDNLGIRIPAGFEKLTEGMSDAEKVSKLFEMTLEAGNKQLEEMGDVVLSKADKMRKLSASFTNLKATGGEFVFDVLEPEVTWLTNAISETDKFITKNNGLNTSFSTLIDTTELVVGTFATWKILNLAADIGSLALKVEWLTKAQLALNVAMSANPYVVVATTLVGVGIYLKQVSDETEEWNKYTDKQLDLLSKMPGKGKELSLALRISFKEAELAAIGSLDEIDKRLDEVIKRSQERLKKESQFVYKQQIQGRDDIGSLNYQASGREIEEMAALTAKKAQINKIKADIESLKGQLEVAEDEDDFGIGKLLDTLDDGMDILDDASTGLGLLGGKLKSGTKAANEAEKQAQKLAQKIEKISKNLTEGFTGKAIDSIEQARTAFMTATAAAAGFKQANSDLYSFFDKTDNSTVTELYESFKDIPPQLKEFNAEVAQLAGNKEALDGVLATLKDFSSFDLSKAASSLNAFDLSNQNYAASATAGMANVFTNLGIGSFGGLLTTDYSLKFIDVSKKEKESLSKTIAEAVSTGFANADFSNFSQTLGQMLSSVLSKSMSNKFPVIGDGGGVNWGNLGINLGVSAATQLLTRSGRFFGGREEHGKEAIQQSADLKTNLSNTWLETFSAGLLPYLSDSAGEMMKVALADARSQIWGTSVGYKWNDSGDGIFSDRTRTYELINSGATAALAELEKSIENAEAYNREVERSIEILVASGKDFAALQQQTLAYQSAADSAQNFNKQQGLAWSDGAKFSTDLGDQIHDLVVTTEELVRQLGSATAERTSIISEGFASYAPWLDTIPLKMAQSSGIRVNIKSPDGSMPEMPPDWGAWSSGINVSDLSTSELYGAFADLQTSFLDREIPNYLVDMVEQAAQNQFDLEKLKITDEDLYQTTYLDYLDRQAEAHKEIVERQRKIFEDETKTYEERAAALQLLEGAIQNYHKIEIEKLQKKAAAEEEEKRLMAQQSRENIESSLSILGELSRRDGNVLIIQGGDVSSALAELMTRFADDPEVTAILKKSKELADAQALWGKR